MTAEEKEVEQRDIKSIKKHGWARTIMMAAAVPILMFILVKVWGMDVEDIKVNAAKNSEQDIILSEYGVRITNLEADEIEKALEKKLKDEALYDGEQVKNIVRDAIREYRDSSIKK